MLLPDRSAIAAYVPHSGDMLLIDRVLEHDPEFIVTETDVESRLPGFEGGHLPAYAGIELMAQSIGAWSGLRRSNPKSRPPIGYLLGSRRYSAAVAAFPVGAVLRIRADLVIENEGLGMFDCSMDMLLDGRLTSAVATAGISVYSEPDGSGEQVESGA